MPDGIQRQNTAPDVSASNPFRFEPGAIDNVIAKQRPRPGFCQRSTAPFLRHPAPPLSVSSWHCGPGARYGRTLEMAGDLSQIDRRIDRLSFQRASGIRQCHALGGRIENHEEIERLSPAPISRSHEPPRADPGVDRLDG